MNEINQQILDTLTRVTFPKGFNKAQVDEVRIINGLAVPVYHYQAVVIGTGAAGLRAAVELKRRNVHVLLASAGLYMGTSACSGSDKQTLFTAASEKNGDNFIELAHALSAGGGMDLDLAYVEAVGSRHTLTGLQYLGLQLPQDRYGAVLRYQTDHDEAGRATSCGPRTSRLMVNVLLEETQRLNIPLLSGATALRLLCPTVHDTRRCRGVIVSTTSTQYNPYRLAIISTPYLVLATGGPGDMYRDSVYPHKCYGSLGLALEAGINLTNIMESQFGIGTSRNTFPWNLSGTYVQVMPYIYSLDTQGREYNFLPEYYRSGGDLASNIFRKGYQWPFHASRTLNYGSSLIDLAIAREVQYGRKVYMDFTRNPQVLPGDDAFCFSRLEHDVQHYLQQNTCNAALPIQRLRQMNPLAIELYKMHGYDLNSTPLEFSVNNQHMNGGIAVDIWGESNLKGCFALGEVAGTHGVTRPGGAALNSGQVFAVRLADKIAHDLLIPSQFTDLYVDYTDDIQHLINFVDLSLQGDGMPLQEIKRLIQNRMSDEAGFLVSASHIDHTQRAASQLLDTVLRNGIKITTHSQITELIIWRHFALLSGAILTMLNDYIKNGGGSRGARIIFDIHGDSVPCGRHQPFNEWRFRNERLADRQNKYFIRWNGQQFISNYRNTRQGDDFFQGSFEKQWNSYLNGDIYM